MIPWLDVAAAARLLGVSPAGVRARIRRGTLVARRDRAGRWQIERASLDAAIGRDTAADAAIAGLDARSIEALREMCYAASTGPEPLAALLREQRSTARAAHELRAALAARVAELEARIEALEARAERPRVTPLRGRVVSR